MRFLRVFRVIVIAVVGLILALGVTPSVVGAHATLIETEPPNGGLLDPEATHVILYFDEPVEVIQDQFALYQDAEDAHSLAARSEDTRVVIELPPDLTDGGYAVSYRIRSVDGHPVAGAISFRVGEGQGVSSSWDPEDLGIMVETPRSTEIVAAGAQWLQLLGLLLLGGLSLSRWTATPTLAPSAARRAAQMWDGAAIVSIVASSILIGALAARAAGVSIAEVDAWRSLVPSDAVIIAVAVTLGLGIARISSTHAPSARGTVGLSVMGVSLAVISPVLIGHSRSVEPVWLMLLTDGVHLAVGAFWFGGVVALWLWLRSAPRDAEDALSTMQRFSDRAAISVGAIVASGVLMAVLILDTLSSAWSTGYGRLLLLKMGLAGVVVAMAGLNRFLILPRISVAGGQADPAVGYWSQLRRVVGLEAVVLVAVIAVTGVLSLQSPRADAGGASPAIDDGTAEPQELALHATGEGLMVHGTVTVMGAQGQELAFHLAYEGESVQPDEVWVRAVHDELGLGPIEYEVTRDTERGHYVVGVDLPVQGEWTLIIKARVAAYSRPEASTTVSITW